MSSEMLEKLLELCRLDNQITWEDADTDKRLLMHIKNGVTYIKDKCGVKDADFDEGGKANALLLAYVRRARSGDTSTFEQDYISDIVSLQTDFDIESGAATDEQE